VGDVNAGVVQLDASDVQDIQVRK